MLLLLVPLAVTTTLQITDFAMSQMCQIGEICKLIVDGRPDTRPLGSEPNRHALRSGHAFPVAAEWL
jgi:hypothetical protein